MIGQSNGSLLERYQRLIEISRDLASTLDLNHLLDRIVDAAADLCHAEAASILLYDEAKKELHFEAATNMEDPSLRGTPIPVDSSVAGWIVSQCKPVIIHDTLQDDRHYDQVGISTQIKTKSLMGVPLVTKDRVIGALEAINKRSGQFLDEDLDLLGALAAQAAVAIENSRLFQQSDLISELVHELRTPMASLNTATHLLLHPDLSQEQRIRFVELIRSEIDRLSELTTAFLDLARLESGRMQFQAEVLDLRPVLVDCAEVMQARAIEKGLSLSLDLPEKLTLVHADPTKIKQVILNLLSNATKYNYPGGQITLRALSQDNELLISVKDTGPGIPPENLKRLFERFYRVPGTEKMAAGTGLGLSICKKIVEAHSGHIEVESEVGKGTTFTVHLPVHREAARGS